MNSLVEWQRILKKRTVLSAGSSTKNKQNRGHVKLHVTLMNSKFLRFGRNRPKNSKFRFNATDILKVKIVLYYLMRKSCLT